MSHKLFIVYLQAIRIRVCSNELIAKERCQELEDEFFKEDTLKRKHEKNINKRLFMKREQSLKIKEKCK